MKTPQTEQTPPPVGVPWSAGLGWLRSRSVIAGDLWREGRINRGECFRLEMDAALGRDTGSIQWEQNTEYADLLADGWTPKRQKP